MTPEQLKASILQRAMEGKLVPQNPNDEPASELLKRIKAEKEKLISEGKIKRDKKETEIFRGDDGKHYGKFADGSTQEIDVPYDIPDTWEWVRFLHWLKLSEVASTTNQRLSTSSRWNKLDKNSILKRVKSI
ncbi:restriction endonuclease S subunit [Streptococcus pneumoniae]|nr:restriction endonuclease S subunit [Streptococcus pneumoniae]